MALYEYIGNNNPDGAIIGKDETIKVAFHGAVPVAQRASSSQAALATTALVGTTFYGFTTTAQGNNVISLVNEIRAALVEKGIIKGSA